MRLGILIDRYQASGGGAEVHTHRLVRRALGRGDEVLVATLEGRAPDPARTLVVAAPRRRPARDRALAAEGIARLREAGAEVVLAFRHAPGCDVYLPHGGLVADAFAAKDRSEGGGSRLRTVRRVLSAKVRYFVEAEHALLASEEGPVVVAVSRALAARIVGVYPAAAGRLVVVPNGVDLGRFDPARFAEGPPAAARRVLREGWGGEDAVYVGLLLATNPRLKGLETAIRALAEERVRVLDPPFHLVLAGGGVPRDLRRLARRLGVDARLHEAGRHDDPRPLLAAADVLVHPTFHDPCSLACLEALAMGRPVLTTPVNGVAELMGARGGIVLERAGDAGALAVAIGVLADRDLRSQTADDARWLVRRHRESTRLDAVLDLCRDALRGGVR